MMKHLKLTLAVLGILVFAAGSAYAEVDLTSATPTVPTFASEITVDATNGTTLTDAGTPGIMDVTSDFGFGTSENVSRYVRIDLSNGAKFDGIPGLVVDTAAGPGAAVGVISAGGTGASYVIFNVTVAANDSIAQHGTATLTTGDVDVFNQSTVTVTYTLYETAAGAANQDSSTQLYQDSASLIKWGAAFTTTVNDAGAANIDVTQESKDFTGATPLQTDVASVKLDANTDYYLAVGTKVTGLSDLFTTATFTMTGVFTAADHVSLAHSAVTGAIVDPGTISADTTTVTTTYTASDAATDTITATYVADGTTAISETTITGAIAGDTYPAGYMIADANLGTLSELQKNGSSARVTFLLTPGGSYANYIRVTNPSTIDGNVYLTLTNDAGDSVTFNLSDISGVTSNILKAGASTALLSIDDVYTAATAKDSTFSDNGGKLRVTADGEFGTTGATSGIVVNAFSLSKDGNTFNMMTNGN